MKNRGFSLPEVMVALVLFALGSGALVELQGKLARSARQQQEFRLLWRRVSEQVEPVPLPLPVGWRVSRQETPRLGCVSISATVITPGGRRGTLSRLHCARGVQAGATDVKGLPL